MNEFSTLSCLWSFRLRRELLFHHTTQVLTRRSIPSNMFFISWISEIRLIALHAPETIAQNCRSLRVCICQTHTTKFRPCRCERATTANDVVVSLSFLLYDLASSRQSLWLLARAEMEPYIGTQQRKTASVTVSHSAAMLNRRNTRVSAENNDRRDIKH